MTPHDIKTEEGCRKELEDYKCTGRYCEHETSEDHYIVDKDFIFSVERAVILRTLEATNPIELAERIVIEYANMTGRESTYRACVREAAIKVLTTHQATFKHSLISVDQKSTHQ